MQEKPEAFIRRNVTIPSDLQRRMAEVRWVNWSRVAVEAFEAKLEEVAKKKK